MKKNMEAIFSPESVAIVGASNTPGKVGHDIFANILKGGYTGTLYPVNPKARSILSVKAYPTISEIPDPVDLAILILPPKISIAAVEEAIKNGIKAIVIVSAGFREVGGEGIEIEDKIISLCQEAGVRLVGPNCLGVINPLPSIRLNASFSARMPAPGNISFISQSGALCAAVLDFAADRDIGFSKFISIGNKADVDELDLLEYLSKDPDTSVIMLYIEELRKGTQFMAIAREITMGVNPTPVLAIKSGRTSEGARAAASHTGALAGKEAVYDAIFKQAGIIRADSIDELFDFATAFSYKQESLLGKRIRKLPKGNRVAIITNAGGPGILATDMTVSSDLELAKFEQKTIEELKSNLPSTANIHNPVDIIGDASQDRYENTLKSVINDDGVDGVLVILTPQSMTNALATAEAITRVARGTKKPIMCCFMGIIDVSSGVKHLQEHGYPVYRFPENAAKAFGALYKYSKRLHRGNVKVTPLQHDKERAVSLIKQYLANEKKLLGEVDGAEILKCYGLQVLPAHLAKSADEATKIAEQIGYPVVMKIVSPQIIHKTEAGGVVLGLKCEEDVKVMYENIIEKAKLFDKNAEIEGVLIQQMAKPGEEVIVGINRSPFGPLIMFGLGGIFVEIFQDVVFRLGQIDQNEANLMIKETKGYKLLTGFRGRPKADLKSIEQVLVSVSSMAVNHPEIKEMDINPLIVHEDGMGSTVADCRIMLE